MSGTDQNPRRAQLRLSALRAALGRGSSTALLPCPLISPRFVLPCRAALCGHAAFCKEPNNAPSERGDGTDKTVDADDQKIASPLQSLVALLAHEAASVHPHRSIACLFQPHHAIDGLGGDVKLGSIVDRLNALSTTGSKLLGGYSWLVMSVLSSYKVRSVRNLGTDRFYLRHVIRS
jgi:hypothetical protein